jgi:hypothetical protein
LIRFLQEYLSLYKHLEVSFIRSKKLPDVYKGKGILVKNESISLKDGKKK